MSEKFTWQPLDRVAISLMLVLSCLIALLLWRGEQVAPKVREFSWQNRQIGVDDTAFILTFSRPMDMHSVEENLVIEPPLPGKISWAGRRLAYTLDFPAPYGTDFQVKLANAREQIGTAAGVAAADSPAMQPFVGQFKTRDRAFAYIGVRGETAGRLVLNNLTRQQTQILTPADWVVLDFRAYPQGDRLLFSAIERSALRQGRWDQRLYTVTTGIAPEPESRRRRSDPPSPGVIELVLDSQGFQNLQFDLANDGSAIVVRRVNKKNPGDFGLWGVRSGQEPQRLDSEPGGDFLITPDSQAIAVAQGQGIALLPLAADTHPDRPGSQEKLLEFLPRFSQALSFTRDGSTAAMLKFNTDFTRSLYLINNRGDQKELLRFKGSIQAAQFDPTQRWLYCLLAEVVEGEGYREQPFLAAIDLQTDELVPLVLLPEQQGIQMHLAPDGLALLFDQPLAVDTPDANLAEAPRGRDGRPIADSRLWFLPLDPTILATKDPAAQLKPEALPIVGFSPRWLP
ncbi:hypothetical protein [Trichothermofontia sp.]